MLTEQEKNELIKEVVEGAVPVIVKAVKEEIAKGNGSDQDDKKVAVNYEELVRNAMK